VQIKKIIILLFVSVTVFSYKLPYSQQQRIYFTETLQSKAYNKISFKVDEKEYEITSSSKNSDDILSYVIANLFIGHKKSLINFQKKHKISTSKSYFRLYDDSMPVLIYGNNKKVLDYNTDDFKPEIWINNEKAYPVKAVFKKDDKIVIAEFSEYSNKKFNFLFPSKVTIIVDGVKKDYYLTF